jgi:hypothetical protein
MEKKHHPSIEFTLQILSAARTLKALWRVGKSRLNSKEREMSKLTLSDKIILVASFFTGCFAVYLIN